MSRTDLSEDDTDVLKKTLGDFYKLPDVIVGEIIEYLKSSDVKNLRNVSRPLHFFVDNEDPDIQNVKRPKHANLALLHYKMLNKERIKKIIDNSPFSFPPNCYYLETSSSQNDKIFSYSQYIVQGESVNIDEIKKNQGGDKYIHFKYYYQNGFRTYLGEPNYIKEGKNDTRILIKAPHLRIDYYEIEYAANHFKHMNEIFKNLRDEDYIFEIPYDLQGTINKGVRYIRYGIKKIS